MTQCAGFSQAGRHRLPEPCVYPALFTVEHSGRVLDVCAWHEKVFAGLITDAGGGMGSRQLQPLSWSPPRPKTQPDPPRDLLEMLREEWIFDL